MKDGQCEQIESVLPGKCSNLGRIAANNRLFVESILWIERTGACGVIFRQFLAVGTAPINILPAATIGEFAVRLTKYFVFYNGERPHQVLGKATPDVVYVMAQGGDAIIIDKFLRAAVEPPVPLRTAVPISKIVIQAGRCHKGRRNKRSQDEGVSQPGVQGQSWSGCGKPSDQIGQEYGVHSAQNKSETGIGHKTQGF